MNDSKTDFYEVQNFFNQAWGNQPYKRGNGWKQFKRWEAFMEPRVHPSGKRPPAYMAWQEHFDFKRKYPRSSVLRAGNWQPLGPDSWQTISYNPGNGRVNVVAQDPNNPNTLYCGVPSGGCWKSTNGGSSWTPLTDQLPVLGVSAITINHANSNVVYIGTGDGDGSDTYSIGVLKSTDGGASWNTTGLAWLISNNRVIRRMVMHPTNPDILWVASSAGIFKTTDGGNTWSQPSSENVYDIEIHPTNPNILYAASDRFFRSADGGNTWQLVTTGLPGTGDVNRASIAVSPHQPDYVYFLAGSDADASFFGLYRSTNAGVSFSLRSNSPNIFCYALDGNDTGGQSWYDIALAVSPTNAEEVHAGGINVWKSTDGGTTWDIKTHWYYPPPVGYVHADIHTLDFFNGVLYCGSDGGLFKSTNGGNDWTDISQGLEIMQFYRFGGTPQNANLLIGGAQDNGTNRYNAGQWTHVIGADGMEAAIDYSNSQIMYGAIQNGGLRRSNDGGQNFTDITGTINDAGAWVTPYVIDPVSPNILYGGFLQLWKTTDRGDNWTQISNFATVANIRSIAVAPSNNQVIYVGTYTDIYRTTDGGANWTTVTNNLPSAAKTYIAVHPNNPNKLWVTLSGYSAGNKVMYSSNGGNSWTNISGNLPNLPVNCIIYQNGSADGIYVGTDVGIYYKDTTLANWVDFMDGLPNVIVNELDIHYGTSKIRAATFGRGVWQSDLYTPSPFPPTANFAVAGQQLCTGEPVQFQDLSVNAIPGWQWYFPGGTPASSTDQNPLVSYASAGNYTAMLIVNNANGSDTLQQNFVLNFANNEMVVALQLDDYPEETSWEITDQQGNIVASGAGYGVPNQLVADSFCLANGCYTFTIYDSYGDGICCGFGSGYYNLIDSTVVLTNGGNFGSSESFPFCLNASLPLSIYQTNSTASSCAAATGTITITAVGGDGNYQYSVNGGAAQSSSTFTGLAAGTYNVVVIDGLGNSDTTVVYVGQTTPPVAIASSNVSTATLNPTASVSFFSTGSTSGASYLWNFGNGATSIFPNPSTVYTQPGIYMVVLSVTQSGCTSTDTVLITIELLQGNAVLPAVNPTLSLQPNPSKGLFSVVAHWDMPLVTELHIYNALGQQVFWQQMPIGTDFSLPINLSNQPNGVYWVLLRSSRFSVTDKWIKAE